MASSLLFKDFNGIVFVFFLEMRKENSMIEPNPEYRVGEEEYKYSNHWLIAIQDMLCERVSCLKATDFQCVLSLIFWSDFLSFVKRST